MSSWTKAFSKTHQREYWFNTKDGTRSWTEPTDVSSQLELGEGRVEKDAARGCGRIEEQSEVEVRVSKRMKREVSDEMTSKEAASSSKPKIAVIVPFRDLHEAQKRQEHLNRFIPEMRAFLERTGSPFEIFIVEQSGDGRKFNRGKLLNIGFDLARKSGCQVFVFHDVDLLPSPDLARYYATLPAQPVHIARVWDRYNNNAKYFGGVVAFSEEMFLRINGFPNNFWGWGGEDDEMYERVKEVFF